MVSLVYHLCVLFVMPTNSQVLFQQLCLGAKIQFHRQEFSVKLKIHTLMLFCAYHIHLNIDTKEYQSHSKFDLIFKVFLHTCSQCDVKFDVIKPYDCRLLLTLNHHC